MELTFKISSVARKFKSQTSRLFLTSSNIRFRRYTQIKKYQFNIGSGRKRLPALLHSERSEIDRAVMWRLFVFLPYFLPNCSFRSLFAWQREMRVARQNSRIRVEVIPLPQPLEIGWCREMKFKSQKRLCMLSGWEALLFGARGFHCISDNCQDCDFDQLNLT